MLSNSKRNVDIEKSKYPIINSAISYLKFTIANRINQRKKSEIFPNKLPIHVLVML